MEGSAYLKPEAILRRLKLALPISITLEDPVSRQPITMDYENLHAMLVIDLQALPLEDQVVSNLYAEMARFQRASEFAAGRAEIRLRKWKAQRSDELREARKRSKEKVPTKEQVEAFYRDHKDYEEMSGEAARWAAIAGLFDDLKWSFRTKSEHMRSASRMIIGYEQVQSNVEKMARAGSYEAADSRLNDYTAMQKEVVDLVAAHMAKLEAAPETEASIEAKRTARAL